MTLLLMVLFLEAGHITSIKLSCNNTANLIIIIHTEGKLDLESILAYLRGRVTFQWYKFGAALGLPSNVLENFVKDSEKYSEEKALKKVLEYWLKNHPTQPSWQEVANALRDIIWIS